MNDIPGSAHNSDARAFHSSTAGGPVKTYIQAQEDQADAALALVRFNNRAAAGELLPDFVKQERARLTAAVRAADDVALRAWRDHATAEQSRASALRAKAGITTDPAQRLADLTERQMIQSSSATGSDLLNQARSLYAAGQVARAGFLWEAAKAKGVQDLSGFGRLIDDALDKDGDRKAAREIEDRLAKASDTFWTQRAQILAGSVGMRVDGTAGSGEGGERVVARIEARTADFLAKQAAGQAYRAPVGDGSNSATENADLARRTNLRLAEQDRFESGQGDET